MLLHVSPMQLLQTSAQVGGHGLLINAQDGRYLLVTQATEELQGDDFLFAWGDGLDEATQLAEPLLPQHCVLGPEEARL